MRCEWKSYRVTWNKNWSWGASERGSVHGWSSQQLGNTTKEDSSWIMFNIWFTSENCIDIWDIWTQIRMAWDQLWIIVLETHRLIDLAKRPWISQATSGLRLRLARSLRCWPDGGLSKNGPPGFSDQSWGQSWGYHFRQSHEDTGPSENGVRKVQNSSSHHGEDLGSLPQCFHATLLSQALFPPC